MPASHDPSLWESICLLEISDKIALVNCILTGLFLLATIISVLCAFKAYYHQKNRARKETACELAQRYSEDIIQHYLFVTDVLEDSGLGSRTKELFPYDALSEFTQDEMNSLLGENDTSYDEIRDDFEHPDPKSIMTAMRVHRPSEQEREDLLQVFSEQLREGTDENRLDIFLQHEFFNKMWEYLNALEWFSMSCRYGIADEEILYQSLHQTFLSSVWQLYFYICRKNITNENKYYTNVIWLFVEWQKRMKGIQREAQLRQSKAQEEFKKAEKNLKEAKPKVYSGRRLK